MSTSLHAASAVVYPSVSVRLYACMPLSTSTSSTCMCMPPSLCQHLPLCVYACLPLYMPASLCLLLPSVCACISLPIPPSAYVCLPLYVPAALCPCLLPSLCLRLPPSVHACLSLCLCFDGSVRVFAAHSGLTATLNAPRWLSVTLEYRVSLFDSLCHSVPSLLVQPEVRWYNGQRVILWSQSDRARHRAEQQFVVGDWPCAETSGYLWLHNGCFEKTEKAVVQWAKRGLWDESSAA